MAVTDKWELTTVMVDKSRQLRDLRLGMYMHVSSRQAKKLIMTFLT